MYIHQTDTWPHFNWDRSRIDPKLAAKRWAKLAKVSLDTAVRDVQHLVELGILIPEEGKVRNIAYGIKISDKKTLIPGPIEEE